MKPKIGDLVEIETTKGTHKGALLPSHDKNTTVIKLSSGYNLGIENKNIKSTKLLEQKKEIKQKEVKITHKKDLKTVAILHTGGTLASEVDYKTGAVTPRFSPNEIIKMFPEIENIVNVKSKFVSNIWSEDMNFKHYNLLAKEIEKEAKAGVDGIIISHGTDTLHYTSAALAFILENLNIPVILVGAQRSSDRGSTDAAMNLICAAKFIAQTEFSEVAICMHENMKDETCLILHACKSRKMHSSRRDAFKSINRKPWARVYFKENKIDVLDNSFRKRESRKLKLDLFKENLKIGFLKAHPNMTAEEIKIYSKFNGLVLEGYGLAGNFPINKTDKLTAENEKILKELTSLAKKIPVVATTQTIFGRINMNVYSTGRKMQQAGILGNLLDMHPETAFIKLAWLLSNHPKQVKELLNHNLRGEITERLGTEFIEDEY
ncbi:MAG: Glu-tRNA(Gln) amidotransferase subunit GatD [Candidatus Woesearchaeota archaeon]|nr:MAG: Glu-tRNA(Gln) amidotransferase subunit GatD [Candidatus Woesearchaeota archaeon]